MAKKRAPEVLLPGRNVRKQSREAFAAEVAKYQADHDNPNHTMLTANELAGDYLLSRGLETTLGGDGNRRLLTLDDLRTFRDHIAALKEQAKTQFLRGGITAKQVIDKSWSDDQKRAQDQIYMANPTHYEAVTESGAQGSSLMVHFMTNAGPDSDFTHHNVNVQFLDFGAVVGSGASAEQMAEVLLKGPLKFECNCGRFKYWFRYVCTQLGIVAGRTETVFPKIRNPGISGIACKHSLRAMQVIDTSPVMRKYIVKAIEKFRETTKHTKQAERIADQRAFEKEREAEAGDWYQETKRKVEEQQAKRQARPAHQRRQQERATAEAVKNAAAEMERNRAQTIRETEKTLRTLMAMGQLDQEGFEATMKTLRERLK